MSLLLALPPASAIAHAAPPSARERSQVLLIEGDEAVERGELDEAISKYRSAYYGLSPEDQASYLGSLPVRQAMRAYEQAIAREEDPLARKSLLGRQRMLLDEFLEAVAAREGAAQEVGADVIAELELIRSSLYQALETDDEGNEGDEGEPPSTEAPSSGSSSAVERDPGITAPPSKRTPPHRDWLGLGLTVGGGAVLATGLGISLGRWTIPASAITKADDEGYPEDSPAREDYLAGEREYAQKFLIAGVSIAGIGFATTIGGVVVLLVRRRRGASEGARLRVVPLSRRNGLGLALHGHF